MLLSECNIGTIVTTIYGDNRKVGHIVGLEYNDAGQVIPVIRWADGKESAIQAYNLVTLKDVERGN